MRFPDNRFRLKGGMVVNRGRNLGKGYGLLAPTLAVMAAGLATLEQLADGRPQKHAAALAARMAASLRTLLADHGEQAAVSQIGCLVQVYFGLDRPPRDHREEARSDTTRRRRYHIALMTQGVFFKPGSEGRVSGVHTDHDIDRTLECVEHVLAKGLHRA